MSSKMEFEAVPARENSPMKLRVKSMFLEPEDAGEKSGDKSRRKASAGAILGGFHMMDDTLETDVGSCSGSSGSTISSTPTVSSATSAWLNNFSAPDLDVVEECAKDALSPPSASVAEIAKIAAFKAQMAAQAHAETMWGNMDMYDMYPNPFQGYGWQPPPYLGSGHMLDYPHDEGMSDWSVWADPSLPEAMYTQADPMYGAPDPRQKRKMEGAKQWASHSKAAALQQTLATQEQDSYTTVMLRNLPNDYTRDMLMALLESQGFAGAFDFVYLPFDFKKHAGLGYAFMNMIDHKEALRAMKDLPGFKEWKLKSNKVMQVTWSTPLQGLAANIERYRNSPVMHEDVPDQFKPLLLKDGVAISFPPPTKVLQVPVNPAMM